MPIFSIVIPTYNRAHLLSETIRSVQAQAFTDWECIIVDDGSSDNTRELVEGFSREDARVRYVWQQNSERSAARNNGIGHAKGQYVCFLDSDDHYLPEHLAQLYNFLATRSFPVAMIIANMEVVEQSHCEATSLPADIPSNLPAFLFTYPVIPGRVCVHRELLKGCEFDKDIVIVEDAILWMRLSEKGSVYFSPHVGVRYHLHEGNSVSHTRPASFKAYKGILLAKKRYPAMFAKVPALIYNERMSRVKTNIAHYWIRQSKPLRALKWILSAILQAPRHEQTRYRLYLIFVVFGIKKFQP